ncbi:hypothetical protein SAMN05216267_1001223 [Actinacidiphila rubida]|uniref:Uncharacterized protein n=1 Tax=Actinacidiphila rubida TaxID=310780 RepID=A0A1H8DPM2_9ACTN|nr:hypothetical protein SAMN05216267_1001223 [Actinacidiphila rubida]
MHAWVTSRPPGRPPRTSDLRVAAVRPGHPGEVRPHGKHAITREGGMPGPGYGEVTLVARG